MNVGTWNKQRPHALVVACSDGRLQENLDAYLAGFGISHYDRLYLPGGAGALVVGPVECMRPEQFRKECRFLLRAHGIQSLYLMFHGPAKDGPAEAACGDYLRKYPDSTVQSLRTRQEGDAASLKAADWGLGVEVHTCRCEVNGDGTISFVDM